MHQSLQIMSIVTHITHSLMREANAKCKHYHMLPWNSFLASSANAQEDVMCEQTFRLGKSIFSWLLVGSCGVFPFSSVLCMNEIVLPNNLFSLKLVYFKL